MAKANPFMEMIAKKKDMAKGKKEMPMKKMASGGMTSSKMGSVKTAAPSRDGVAVQGKTKGKMVTMKSGGKAYCLHDVQPWYGGHQPLKDAQRREDSTPR